MEKKRSKIIIIGFLIVSILRMGLMQKTPLYIIGNASYDDQFCLYKSMSIFNGEWLGSYDKNTLIKGVSYSLFLAFSRLVCMPYLMLLSVIYILAAALLLYSLRSIIKNDIIKLAIFTLVLFNPVGLATDVTYRVYRNALIYPVVMIVISSFIGAYLESDRKKRIVWLIFAGLFFSFFYFLREDSIWLIPLAAVSCILIIIDEIVKTKKGRFFFVGLIPIVIFSVSTVCYCYANYSHYGFWGINDRSGGYFGKLVGIMPRIAEGKLDDDDIWVSRETLDYLLENSETLNEISPDFKKSYSDWVGDEEAELNGDYYVWALRDALSNNGYYESAEKVDSFCEKAYLELESALDEGRLHEADRLYISSQANGIKKDNIPKFIVDTIKNCWKLNYYFLAESYPVDNAASTYYQTRCFETVTGNLGIYTTTHYIKLSGWAIEEDDEDISINIVDSEGELVSSDLVFKDSADIAEEYPDYYNSEKARFEVDIKGDYSTDDLLAEVTIGDKCFIIPISEEYEGDGFIYHADYYGTIYDNDTVGTENNHIYKVSNMIIEIYRRLARFVNLGALLCFALVIILSIAKESAKYWKYIVVSIGVLLSGFLLTFGTTVFSSWLGESAIWFYSVGVVPCFHIVLIINYAIVVTEIVRYLKNRNKTRISETEGNEE